MRWEIKMGHYESSYEYDEEQRQLEIEEENKKKNKALKEKVLKKLWETEDKDILKAIDFIFRSSKYLKDHRLSLVFDQKR